jgi:hypothetical protein
MMSFTSLPYLLAGVADGPRSKEAAFAGAAQEIGGANLPSFGHKRTNFAQSHRYAYFLCDLKTRIVIATAPHS